MSSADRPLDVLLAASEVVGFAKTGGLADVAGSLPRALTRRGHRCRIILPLYRAVRERRLRLEGSGLPFTVPVGGGSVTGRIQTTHLTDPDVTVYLVEQPDYFERDDPSRGTGLYHLTAPDGSRRDYPDNCERFVFFSRAVLEACRLLDGWPDVLHANDWQTGLVPVYLEEEWRRHWDAQRRTRATRTRSVFTVHNLAYQGRFWKEELPLTGIGWDHSRSSTSSTTTRSTA
jgi:starch synthase